MYRRNFKGWAKHLDFIVWDCLSVIASFFAAHLLCHGSANPFMNSVNGEMLSVFVMIDFLLILFMDSMKDVLKRGVLKELGATLRQTVGLLLCSVAYMYVFKLSESYSRIAFFLMAAFYLVISFGTRLAWKKLIRRNMENGSSALLILASEATAPKIIDEIQTNNFAHHKIVGLVVHDAYKVGKTVENVPVVATYDTVVDYVVKNWVDEVLISLNPYEEFPGGIVDELTLMGVTVHLTMDKYASKVGARQTVGHVGGMVVLTSAINYMTPRQYFVKRAIDILGGLAGCVITGILYLFLAPAIKKESPGPVFFTQERVGRNGKPFKIYKFRSMYLDAEARKQEVLAQNRRNDNLMFKMDFDPRVIGNKIDENGNQVTGIGEFIRKYSLDEFPQFYNVLKGDMSMIGTRPPLMDEYAEYSAHHKARLAAKPGITGMWQVSGRSNVLDFEEVVKLDTQYINNWSLALDIKIIFKTIAVVLKKEGSM